MPLLDQSFADTVPQCRRHRAYEPCPFCVPQVTDAEKDRRLKAFMPLIHTVSQYRMAALPEGRLAEQIEEVERILEIIENPRRKVGTDGE